MEESKAASGQRDGDTHDDDIGKEFFWSSLLENYALIEIVSDTTPAATPHESKQAPLSVDTTEHLELGEALNQIKKLKATNSKLGQTILNLENAQGTGGLFNPNYSIKFIIQKLLMSWLNSPRLLPNYWMMVSKR